MADAHRPRLTQADEAFANLAQARLGVLNMPLVAHRGFRRAVDWMQAALDLAPEPSAPRVHTGYMPKAQRRAVAHRAYSDGLRTPPRLRAEDRTRAEALKWGLA